MTLTLTELNGRLPDSALALADTGRNGPQLLRRDAAAVWRSWLAQGMPAGCLTSGYRDRSEQAAEVERARRGETPSAAPVGTSFHGEGVAADVAEPARAWLRRWGGPAAVFDTVPGEPWHVLIDAERHPAPVVTISPATAARCLLEADMIELIRTLYLTYCDRNPGGTELLSWSDKAAGGTWNPAETHAIFRRSAAESGTVRGAYRLFLRRSPSDTEVRHWANGTRTIAEVWEGIKNSPEARAKAGA